MKKKRSEESFINKPVYPGGQKAISAFIGQHIKYPPAALDAKKEGTVNLKYEIDYRGNVIGSKVISSLGYGCDEEAQRLVKLLKFEIAKNPRKLKIKFQKSIRINFKLPKPAAKPKAPKPNQVQSIAYTTTPKPMPATSNKEAKQNSGVGYSYTISW